MTRCARCLCEQVMPGTRQRHRQAHDWMIAKPLQQSDRPEDLEAGLGFGVRLTNEVAGLEDLLVRDHLLLGRHEPDDRLGLGRQEPLVGAGSWRPKCRSSVGRVRVFQEAHARLRAAQHVRLHEAPQLLAEVLLEPHGEGARPPDAALVDGLAEVLREGLVVAEEARLGEVHQGPEVLQSVLHRRAREQDAALRLDLPQALANERGYVPQRVGLVADDDVPGLLLPALRRDQLREP
mmetsp:Transcript_3473/g.10240  ORF Transcript_3473/g.10240 Transcript_3473/m.10240 type:complete len:236 (+) Transcript_3473:1914-2621(+)